MSQEVLSRSRTYLFCLNHRVPIWISIDSVFAFIRKDRILKTRLIPARIFTSRTVGGDVVANYCFIGQLLHHSVFYMLTYGILAIIKITTVSSIS